MTRSTLLAGLAMVATVAAGSVAVLSASGTSTPSTSATTAAIKTATTNAVLSASSNSTPATSATTTVGAASGSGGTVAAVAIREFAFNPPTITVHIADTVTWTNSDLFDHAVVALDKSFASPHLGGGATFSSTFTKAGTFKYLCGIHNSMTGTVVVTP